jgi:Crinkler effector protein N-terminal domain
MNVTLELWCIVSGDSRPFTVSISTHDNISVLKERIYDKNKNGVLRDLREWAVAGARQVRVRMLDYVTIR